MIRHLTVSMGRFDNLAFRVENHLRNRKNKASVELRKIPVIINNFNRLEFLHQQLDWLRHAGFKRIYIIDNCSSYQPLLDFYKKTSYTVFRLDENVGFEALWKTIIFQRFCHSYYIYTDPDIIPDAACGIDAIARFYELLQKYPQVQKAGFGLRIDDLPNHYPLKDKVLRWESKFWKSELEENVFNAPIDTTFALYRPGARGGSELEAVRTGPPYMARHLTWYVDFDKLSDEERFYMLSAENSASWYAEYNGKERSLKY